MKQFFLFQRRTEPGWSQQKKTLFWVYNWGLVLLSGVCLGLVCLLLPFGPAYALSLAKGFLAKPLLIVLNVLPAVLFITLFYGLTGRAWISFGLTAAICVGGSMGNYYKLAFRDDPVMMGDLLILKEAGKMAKNYSLFLDWKIGLALACVAFGLVVLFFLVRGKPGKWHRLGGVAAALVLTGCLTPAYLSENVYNRTSYYELIPSRWSSTQQFMAHGFLYPFLHSAKTAVETPPPGYNERETEDFLHSFQDGDIPEDQKVNIVGIMLEAYQDFTYFGTPELAQDVYAVWHDLSEEGYSGRILTNIFAGGTVDTERSFLTGYSSLGQFRKPTNAYPWYFREQGYRAEGMHPCFEWFYNRRNINTNLGFEDYRFVENYFGTMTNGGVAMDKIFMPELLKWYQEAEQGEQPLFSFSVSYQGHGPYEDQKLYWGELGDYIVNDGRYTVEEQSIMENYFGSIADTNQHLKVLTDYFRQDEEPVILVLFGDHNPWMGDANSVYDAMGLTFDMDTAKGFIDYYTTPYIIWANPAAEEALGREIHGDGPMISPCFLMQEIFDLCGWEGPAYMQASREVSAQVPVINVTKRYLEDGNVTTELKPENQELVDRQKALEHYVRNHFFYEDLRED